MALYEVPYLLCLHPPPTSIGGWRRRTRPREATVVLSSKTSYGLTRMVEAVLQEHPR